MAYGQAPATFDDLPLAEVEREIEILAAIRQDGDDGLTNRVFIETLGLMFSAEQ
jgi:hypothetical protein